MILETMQSDPSSANFADSMAFSFEVDELPLDTPTVLGELAAVDGVLNTPVNRDGVRFNFLKPYSEVNTVQPTKVALSGERRAFVLGLTVDSVLSVATASGILGYRTWQFSIYLTYVGFYSTILAGLITIFLFYAAFGWRAWNVVLVAKPRPLTQRACFRRFIDVIGYL